MHIEDTWYRRTALSDMLLPDGKETFVLCRSAERREKEKAIHERFTGRIESGLTKLNYELRHARNKGDKATIERCIGWLQGRN